MVENLPPDIDFNIQDDLPPDIDFNMPEQEVDLPPDLSTDIPESNTELPPDVDIPVDSKDAVNEPDWLDNWLIEGRRKLNDMKISLEENPIQVVSEITNSSPLEHLKAMSPELGQLITNMEQGIEIPEELKPQDYQGMSEEEIVEAAKLDRGVIELSKIYAELQLGGAATTKLLGTASKAPATKAFFSLPIVQKVVAKTVGTPVLGNIIQGAAQGSIGFTTYTAVTGLPKVALKAQTLDEFLADLKQAPVTGAKIGGALGGVTGVIGAVQTRKAQQMLAEFNAMNPKNPLKPLSLTAQETDIAWRTPSLMKNGESVKHQIWLRSLAPKALDVKHAKLLNKLLVGQPKVKLDNKTAFEANRKLEMLVGYGEFHPAQLGSARGIKQLQKSIKNVSKFLHDPSVNRIHGKFVPGHALAERYGTSEVLRAVNNAKTKTVDQITDMNLQYDKVVETLRKGNYAKSSDKIVKAMEPQEWGLTPDKHKKLIKSMTPDELKAFKFYKQRVKQYETILKGKGKKTIKNYFTHIRSKTEAYAKKAKELERPLDPDEIKSIKAITSRFEKSRKLKSGEYLTDVDYVLREYEKSMIKAMNNDGVAKLADQFKKTHDLTAANKKWLDKNVQENLFGQTKTQQEDTLDWLAFQQENPTLGKIYNKFGLDKVAKKLGVQGKTPLQAYGNLFTRLMTRKALGVFNIKHFVRNVTTQRMYANTMTNGISGLEAEKMLMLQPKVAAKLLAKSRVFKNYTKLAGEEAALGMDEIAYRMATNSSVAKRMGFGFKKVAGSGAKMIADLGYVPLKKGAVSNASKAFLQGYIHARSKGLGELASIQAGDTVSETTQYLYTYTNKLQAFKGDWGKLYGLFGSWTPNHFQYMKRALGIKGFSKLMTNVVLTTAIAEVEGKLDPYFKSGGFPAQYANIPVFKEGITAPLDLVEGWTNGMFKDDWRQWKQAKQEVDRLFSVKFPFMDRLKPSDIGGLFLD